MRAEPRTGSGHILRPIHRVLLPLATLALIPVTAVACGSSASTAPTTPPSTVASAASSSAGTTVSSSASPGCGTAATAGTTNLVQDVDGHTRTAIVHLPTHYDPSTPEALVLNMHGSQSTALQQEVITGMNATADADTFVVVYPQGGIPSGRGFEWNVPDEPLLGETAVPADAPDDVSYLEQLVTTLEGRYCLDPDRIYATGFSGGARMASQLGCDASGVVAAVAPVSGLRFPTPCPSTRPVPVVSFHGTADPVDPYHGHGQAYWTYSVPTAAQRWAAHNGCSAQPTTTQLHGGVTLASYRGCRAGSAVELYTIAGEGHDWPGGPGLPRSVTKLLGPQSDTVSANSVMWAFFVAHRLT